MYHQYNGQEIHTHTQKLQDYPYHRLAIIESLEKWTSLINSFIDSLGIDPRKLKELEERGTVEIY